MLKKITDFKVIFICPDHNEKYSLRKQYMEGMLKHLGFQQIEHYKSSNTNYPQCLLDANIDILQNNLNEPFLLLEDDVEFTGVDEIYIEKDVDAIYLGISRWGGHQTDNIWCGESKFEKYNQTQVKVINCLSTHAILYLSRRFKEAVIDLFKNKPKIKQQISRQQFYKRVDNIPKYTQHKLPYIRQLHTVVEEIEVDENWNTDVLLSRIQKNFKILANKKPSFFQSNKFNSPHDLEASTKFEICL